MRPDKQRTEIAKACGWTVGQDNHWYSPLGNDQGFWYENELPNYLNDLNAMHEAEKMLKNLIGNNWVIEYERSLIYVLRRDDGYPGLPFLWKATAPQRAEAFLKTIGKWEE